MSGFVDNIFSFLGKGRFLPLMLTISLASFDAFSQSKKSDKFFAQGMEAFQKDDYAKAIDCFSQADALDKKELPAESSRAWYAESWIAHCYYKSGDIDKAKEYDKYHYSILPADRRLTVESDGFSDIAYKAMNEGNYEAALESALKCIELEERILGKNSVSYAGSCVFIAQLYQSLKKYDKVMEYCEAGLDAVHSMGLENDAISFELLQGKIWSNISKGLTALTFSDMGRLKAIAEIEESEFGNRYPDALVKMLECRIELRNNNREKAGDLITQAFRIMIDLYDPDNKDLFLSICDCLPQFDLCDWGKTVPDLLNEALPKLKEKGLSSEHEGMILSWLGDYAGDLESSLSLHEQAASLLKGCEDQDRYFANQCMLAQNYADRLEIRKAIDIYEDVCRHYEGIGSLNGIYILALKSLGDLYQSLGDSKQAASKFKVILSLLNDQKSNPDYVLSYLKWIPVAWTEFKNNNLSADELDDISKEFQRITSSFNINDFTNYGIGIPQIASAMFPCIQLYMIEAGFYVSLPYQKLEQFLSLLVYDGLIPSCSLQNSITLYGMSLLAHANYLIGNNDKAISLISQVIDIKKGEGWPYDNFIHDLGYYQYDSGDTENAYPNFRIGYDFLKEEILKHYRWMTLEERANLTNMKRANLDNLAHYAAITPQDTRYAQLGYDALLLTKGLLLNSSIELTRLLQEEGDDEALRLLAEWRKVNQQLEAAQSIGHTDVEVLKARSDNLEKQLIEKSKSFGDYTKGLTVTWQDVRDALKPGDVAVELCSYQKNARSRQYDAIMLTKDSSPEYVDLGLDTDWNLATLPPEDLLKPGLFDRIFSNLKPFLPKKDVGNIYFAPDGLFHTVPVESLAGAEDYGLRRVSSTRELALNTAGEVKASSAVLFGGIRYGLGELSSYYESSKGEKRSAADFLADLPSTLEEINNISSIFAGKIKAECRSAEAATKSNFRKYSGTHPDILHIATHGFFVSDGVSDENNVDPMLCSGLYFAGAQNTLWAMDTDKLKDNGILTAKEISSLDFRGTDLVVLSACETGRGDINPDGVFGLQRGFKQAGAKSLLMSLWKVDDELTGFLMTRFYSNLLDGHNQYEALRSAQTDARSAFPDSPDWAAFILIDADNKFTF